VRVLVDVLDDLLIYSKDGVRTECMNVVISRSYKQILRFCTIRNNEDSSTLSSRIVDSLCNLLGVGAGSIVKWFGKSHSFEYHIMYGEQDQLHRNLSCTAMNKC
jgi:hypothetical protein